MIDILILILINSALCFGFYNACYYEPAKNLAKIGSESTFSEEHGEIKGVLWFIEKWAIDKWFYKPLCGCLPCMASLHSIYPYWTYMYSTNAININAVMFYPVYVLALSGINYLIDRE